jgi:hypothetical protein
MNGLNDFIVRIGAGALADASNMPESGLRLNA